MPVETAADRANMLSDWDEASYTGAQYPHPSSETIDLLEGVFDNDYVELNGMEGKHPIFTCQTGDIPNAKRGARMTINGTGYTVQSVQPDGTGITLLVLELYDRP